MIIKNNEYNFTEKRCLGVNERGNIEWFLYDPVKDKAAVQEEMSLDNLKLVMDQNKIDQNDGTNGFSKERELRKIARIPAFLVDKWKVELGIDINTKEGMQAVKKLLRSSDYQYLRTVSGNI